MRGDVRATYVAPLDPNKAAGLIRAATDRRRIFELVLAGVRSKTRFAAVLSVHTQELRGQFALADAAFDTRPTSELRIPRNVFKRFEAAISSGSPSVGAIVTGEPFVDGYLEALGQPTAHVLVMPILIATRVVALVVAHRGDAELKMEDVSSVFTLVAATGQALSKNLATRTRAAATSGTPVVPADAGYEVEVTDVNAKRTRLATLRSSESWAELASAIRELVREGIEHGEPAEDEQLELLLELGTIELRLGHPDRAIDAWRSAQAIDAADTRVLDALERAYVQGGQWAEVADLLEKKAALAESVETRTAILLELAAITDERLHDDDRTIAAYERILSFDPGHHRAGKELEARYSQREDWQALVALLLDRASRHDDPQERVAALMAVANLYESRIGDGRDAFLVWMTVFRREPERPHLIEQLARLADNASHLHEVVAETHALADELAPEHPRVAANLWRLVGTWQRDRMGNRDAAAVAFDHAARLDPDAAVEAAAHLRSDERWPELAALLTRLLETAPDAKRRAELCCELGELYETHLAQPGEATRWFERAHDHDPDSSAPLVALHRLYLDGKAWYALGELLPQLIDTLGASVPREVIVDLHVELGQILVEHLGRPDEAIEAFREALALDGKHEPAFRGLAQVYESTGQTEALLDTSEAEVDAIGGPLQAQRYADIAA
ncbi:MAG TPA: tetratricopeptide repeat protein, partial [Kofleriaceae bacterium]|nr:tetratricopeptide repeat protein [Kofleriaceae bacterium]